MKLLIILLLALPIFGQTAPRPDDLDTFIGNFETFRQIDGITYPVNFRDVERRGDRVAFWGFVYSSKTSHFLSEFVADCETYKYTEKVRTGIIAGIDFRVESDEEKQISKTTVLGSAIRKACGERIKGLIRA